MPLRCCARTRARRERPTPRDTSRASRVAGRGRRSPVALPANTPKRLVFAPPAAAVHRARRERRTRTCTYKLWVSLSASPAEMAAAAREGKKAKPACPKQVGNWEIMQESQITGDERTGRKRSLRVEARVAAIPQCRWNFLRSQTVEQVEWTSSTAENRTSPTARTSASTHAARLRTTASRSAGVGRGRRANRPPPLDFGRPRVHARTSRRNKYQSCMERGCPRTTGT